MRCVYGSVNRAESALKARNGYSNRAIARVLAAAADMHAPYNRVTNVTSTPNKRRYQSLPQCASVLDR
jgi:hypothetical protein